jgi:hypothetical protein
MTGSGRKSCLSDCQYRNISESHLIWLKNSFPLEAYKELLDYSNSVGIKCQRYLTSVEYIYIILGLDIF